MLTALTFYYFGANSTQAQSALSSGVVLSILKTKTTLKNALVQISISNNTKSRIYVKEVFGSENMPFLQSGQTLNGSITEIKGISACGISAAHCLQESESKDLITFSYIEPGENLEFQNNYFSPNSIDPTDKMSFSATLLVRAAPMNGDSSQAGAANIVRFNLRGIPVNH